VFIIEIYVQRKSCHNLHIESPKFLLAGIREPMVPIFGGLANIYPKAKLRLEVLFKKFHPRINLATLFSTKLYLLNTIKPFSG
jgi:hypothetical protein